MTQKLLKLYENASLIPFSHTIETDEKNKKKLSNVPAFTQIKEYDKQFIKPSFNALSIRTGTKTDDGFYIIAVDIDKKDDTETENNGYNKWFELLKEHNINDVETPTQKTGNNGLHYLFKVDEVEFMNIRPIIGLVIDDKKYSIDIKTENGFIIVEPSTYNNKFYKGLKKPYDTTI